MFNKLKLKVGHRRLRKALKGIKRNRLVYNLDTARTIGVLFNATSEEVYHHVANFSNQLLGRNLQVEMLAFFAGKEVPNSYLANPKLKLFTKRELNWYRKPCVPHVDEFIDKEFDILIDLSMEELFPLKWIATLSKSKFKVGNLSYYGTPNDMIINLKPNNDIEYLLSQVIHYLQLINNRFAQEANE